jgi:flagellar protein FliS
MSSHDAADAYRQATFENAPPLKIVRMLYQGALRFLREARAIDPTEDRARFVERLGRADAIVAELRCSLDFEKGGEISRQLEELYGFVTEQLSGAIVDGDVAQVDEATRVLETLLAGWNQIDLTTGEAGQEAA